MGKMTAALILVFAIEIALYIFMSQTCVNVPGDLSAGNAACHTSLFNLLINPTSLSTDSLFGSILSNIGKIATLSAIIVGFFFILRVEVAYAGMAAIFATFIWNIVQVWNVIYSQQVFGESRALIATLIAGPLLVFYFIATFDYIRRPD